MSSFYSPSAKVTVRHEGIRVLLIRDGLTLLDLPWDAALELSKAFRIQAARAEQTAKTAQVIADQALLIRKGLPISLTPNPAVFKEAGNEAAHNRDLRRFIPGGVPDKVEFGFPRLRGKARIGATGIKSMEKVNGLGG